MIRKIKESDIKSIISLELETLNTTLGEKIFKDSISNPMDKFYVYEDNEEVIGYISISFDGYQGEILNFCVKKDYQHKGIGSSLLNHAIVDLSKMGATSFILEVRESNVNAISLYNKFDFKEISVRKNYYSNGEDAKVLIKEI